MITITDKALEHLLRLRKEKGEDYEKFNLRVGVKGGGCSGFSYVLEFDSEINVNDEVINICDNNILFYFIMKIMNNINHHFFCT